MWLPFSSATTNRARKAWAFFSCMAAGECNMVKRHTLVTKVLRSMPMPSRDVTLMAATNPPKHRSTICPACRAAAEQGTSKPRRQTASRYRQVETATTCSRTSPRYDNGLLHSAHMHPSHVPNVFTHVTTVLSVNVITCPLSCVQGLAD